MFLSPVGKSPLKTAFPHFATSLLDVGAKDLSSLLYTVLSYAEQRGPLSEGGVLPEAAYRGVLLTVH